MRFEIPLKFPSWAIMPTDRSKAALSFVFYIGLDVFTLMSVFIPSFVDCVMLVMVRHLHVKGTMTTWY